MVKPFIRVHYTQESVIRHPGLPQISRPKVPYVQPGSLTSQFSKPMIKLNHPVFTKKINSNYAKSIATPNNGLRTYHTNVSIKEKVMSNMYGMPKVKNVPRNVYVDSMY